MKRLALLPILVLALLAAGCGGDDDEAAGTTTAATAAEACAKDQLTLVTPGTLTVGTDNPAFPAWFEGGTPEGSSWEINDPATGEGFESAVALLLRSVDSAAGVPGGQEPTPPRRAYAYP